MPDREKVIRGLECCVLRDPDDSRRCAECPKSEYGRTISNSCINGLMVAALALLKAQEPVETTIGRAVEHDGHDSWWYQCGKCEKPIDWQDNYCRHCGMAVKWDG